jgi:hypothetical protein
MKYSKEERLAKRKERLALLDQAVESLKSSEAWEGWLEVRRNFHAYSWRNQLMIAIQRPDTIAVKGFHGWKALNRKVKKGSKAIWILAPRPFTVEENGEERKKISFAPVSVFAYEDTEQIEGYPEIPLTPPLHDVEGSTLEHELGLLRAWLEDRGVRTTFRTLDGAKHGFFRPGGPEIVICDRFAPNSMFKTLVHEAAHYLRHLAGDTYDYDTEEVIVESTAYAVCATHGIETSGYSAGYVASWGEGRPNPEQLVQLVDELATTIEEATGASDRRSAEPEKDAETLRPRPAVPSEGGATISNAA